MVPESEVAQLQVITGGIDARYGDVTGGIISITTKGPSAKFGGGFEVETSQFLDEYDYNLGSLNLSGPILKNKDGESILGFRVSARALLRRDDDPPAINVYSLTDEARAALEENPVTIVSGGIVPSAEFLTNADVNELGYQPNEQNSRYDLTAKLDARLSKAIDVTFTGTGNQVIDYFTPGEGSTTGTNWRVLNNHNNPFDTDTRYRGNFRFRHRLGAGSSSAGSEEGEGSRGSLIRNASYVLQAGYEKNEYTLADPTHGDNLFNYGYVGQFDVQWNPFLTPTFNPEEQRFVFDHGGYQDVFTGYTPSTDINAVLANYNKAVDNEAAFIEAFPVFNGGIQNNLESAWGFHTNIGRPYNLNRKRDRETVTLNANISFELLPGGSDKGKHTIELGFLNETRTNRGYDINPYSLWRLARQGANIHISGLDFDAGPIGDTIINGEPWPLYAPATEELAEFKFYRSIRELTGAANNEYVNVDALTPDQLSLDMFSARELNDRFSDIGLNYWGYDYLGNEFDGNFEDFFTATDADGLRTFPVAPNRPIYTAAFVQDKFTFRDIILRLGVRVDRFDANTQVLRDPYDLYAIQSAADYHAANGGTQPGTIGDDFKVYTEGNGSDAVIKAYRDGDVWYTGDGTQVNSGTEIFGGDVARPAYVNPDAEITSVNFNPDDSFQDYTPQVNIMPRLAFSFPISDEANFFAHYDILVQRPPSNAFATGLDYFYFNSRNATNATIKNNANLRPERTIDYEVGFQQKLSNSSALKLSAYYKELRDMIQSRIFQFVGEKTGIVSYNTYDNLDFGTVKGFSAQYDLRRTGNVKLILAYTLQFADGTGSDANSSRGLSSRGIQRQLYPLSFDERHRVNVNIDYRYGSGKRYNGPRVFGRDIFANAGLNLQAIAVSGRPYTARQVPDVLSGSQTEGSINGARLPWNTTINARIDKDFTLVKGKEGSRGLNMNVFFRVSNLLDARNIIQVYPATGSPINDGYLTSARGLDVIDELDGSSRSLDAYLASYQWRVLNPNFYSLPRRMFVGARFDF